MTTLIRTLLSLPILLAAVVVATADDRLILIVNTGSHDRQDTPLQVELNPERCPSDLLERIRKTGPAWAAIQEMGAGDALKAPQIVQVDLRPSGRIRLAWVLAGRIPSGESRRFLLDWKAGVRGPTPWSWDSTPEGALALSNRGRKVFQYNVSANGHPGYPPILQREAYIHPAYTPSGAVITGDFSRFHPHHRGFFLAYTKTHVGDLQPDFWNIQGGKGKIYCERLGPAVAGPVTARFSAEHRWEAGGKPVLRERWDVEAFDIPGSPYWLFDLTSTQQAVGDPVHLEPYRYGGMAYRGPDSFQPAGVLDVLTSEGLDRVKGDQKPARWVDLTGPIEDGSKTYAGALIADHPSNVNHPTVARIHPTSLPFFTYVPGHDVRVTIGSAEPRIFRYRILIHDGHPDAALDERLWRDFAEPPQVEVTPVP